jgi:hypothetical protein
VSPAFWRRLTLVLAVAGASAGTALAMTLAELQRLMQSHPARAVAFDEVRESPWLATPLQSQGTLSSGREWLEKHVSSQREETWRLWPDRMEWVGPDGAVSKQVKFSAAPALGALADTLRRAVAGDLVGLERDFRIQLGGDERLWTVHLEPRAAELARHLDHLELQGTGARLQVIIIVERSGERTTTRLHH